MAIQDDNTILNKGDLKAYHEAIAPMLGGTFMVRTNNSDYYSTDEKVVGVWTDGKPLYMRTFTTTLFPSSGTGALTEIDDAMAPANMETAFKVNCYMIRTVGGVTSIVSEYYVSDSDRFSLAVGDGWTWYVQRSSGTVSRVVLTVAYTKTTDTAGSATTTPGAYDINFPNTWPENTEVYFGNGLYGKRITGSVTLVAGTRQDIIIASGISSSGKIVSQGGHVLTSQNWKCPIPWSYSNHGSTPGTNFETAAYTQLGPSIEHLLYIYTDILAGNTSYDVWVTYTK